VTFRAYDSVSRVRFDSLTPDGFGPAIDHVEVFEDDAPTTFDEVVDADNHEATPPGHPGAIYDQGTDLLWLDATETDGRSLTDVESELGEGGEFEGWRLGTRAELWELFTNAGLDLTSVPGTPVSETWREDSDLVSRVQDFVGIYGLTQPTDFCGAMGTEVWHANTFDDPAEYASEFTGWDLSDGCFGNDGVPVAWVGDVANSVTPGEANSDIGVALVTRLPEPSSTLLAATALLTLTALARWRRRQAPGS
jgi:hypothetical protein